MAVGLDWVGVISEASAEAGTELTGEITFVRRNMGTATAIRTAPKTVMVVEDEGLIALDLQRHLENFGYVVPVVTKTADEAVRLQAEHLPDLILMDIHLKGERDGIDAAADIRKNSDVPIIFLTAYADPATIERAKVTGALGYIVKPFVSINIRAQIEFALHKHQVERELRQSEALFSTTLRNIGEAVITTGIDDKVEFMNSAVDPADNGPQVSLVEPGMSVRNRSCF
jgi:CheY-like chemotaxis protein